MVRSIILVVALCIDTFVAGMAYGANRVAVALEKVLFLNAVCSLVLGLSLGAGTLLGLFVSGAAAKVLCAGSLLVLGALKCLDWGIKSYINQSSAFGRSLSFSLSGLRVIVHIYGDPMAADADGSHSLGWQETLFLAMAMSIDSLGVGTMAAFLDLPRLRTLFLAFVLGIGMMEMGLWLGRRAALKWKCDLGWVSGLLLICLGAGKAFGN